MISTSPLPSRGELPLPHRRLRWESSSSWSPSGPYPERWTTFYQHWLRWASSSSWYLPAPHLQESSYLLLRCVPYFFIMIPIWSQPSRVEVPPPSVIEVGEFFIIVSTRPSPSRLKLPPPSAFWDVQVLQCDLHLTPTFKTPHLPSAGWGGWVFHHGSYLRINLQNLHKLLPGLCEVRKFFTVISIWSQPSRAELSPPSVMEVGEFFIIISTSLFPSRLKLPLPSAV